MGRTYRHKRQCQPNSSEHRGGDGALLVGVAQAGVPTVETPLVRTDRGTLQNQAGQHSYTHKYGGMYEPTPALAADPHPKWRQSHVSTMLLTCNLRKKDHVSISSGGKKAYLLSKLSPAASVDGVTPGYCERRLIKSLPARANMQRCTKIVIKNRRQNRSPPVVRVLVGWIRCKSWQEFSKWA